MAVCPRLIQESSRRRCGRMTDVQCELCQRSAAADARLCRGCAGAEAERIIVCYPQLGIPRGRGRHEWEALKRIGKNPNLGRFEAGRVDRGNAYYAKIEFD